MGKCISKCFMIYQNRESIISQNTIRTQTSVRLQLQQLNIQNEVRKYFPYYHGDMSIQWKDIMVLIKKQLHKYKDKNKMVSNEYLIGVLQKYEKYYFRKDDIIQLLNIVIEVLKNPIQQKNNKQQKIFINIHKQVLKFGSKLSLLSQLLKKNHKASIQQLKFICQHNKQKQYQHQHHHKQLCHKVYWSDFKFDMTDKQIQTVVNITRTLTQNDLNSFSFLTLYLQISLENKARQMKSQKLEDIYMQHLDNLVQKYNAKDVLLFDSFQLKQKLKQLNQIDTEQKQQCIFEGNKTPHYDQLRYFLVQKCLKVKKDETLIIQLIKQLSKDNNICQLRFQQRKICQQENLHVFNKKLIKLLDNKAKYKDKFKQLKQSIGQNVKRFQKTSNLTVQQLAKMQDEKIDRFFRECLQDQQKQSIDLKEIGMKVRCYFNSMEQLITATNRLIQNIENKLFQVIAVENRLNYIQKDIRLTVRLPQSIVTIFMTLRLQSIANEFNQKLITLKQIYHPIYSPLTHLYRINKFESNKFFTQMFQRFQHMSKNQLTQNHSQQITELNAQIDIFKIKYLNPFGISIESNSHQNFEDISQIVILIKEINTILKQQSIKNKSIHLTKSQQQQRKINQILLSYGMKDFTKAKQLIFKLKEQQIHNNQLLLYFLGDIYKEQNDLTQSLQYYLKSQKLYQQKNLTQTTQYIQILEKSALIHQLKQNYKESLEIYQEVLLIKQKIYQPGSIKCAQTLYKLGLLYQKQQLYENSTKFYKLALQIHSQSFNQNSPQYASILKSLGNVLQLRKLHDKAIICYEKYLKLQYVFHGYQSSSCAQIFDKLAVSYLFKAEYEKSFQCYFKSLQIKQKINGKNSLSCSTTLSGIGSVYEKKDEYEPALKYYKYALQIIQLCYGKQSIQCVRYINYIIVVFYHQQKYQQALAYGLKCLHLQQKQKGKQSIDCSGTLFGLSLAYEKLGMKHQAYTVCRRSYKIRKFFLGDQHCLTQQSFNRGQYLLDRQNENCLRDFFTL